MKYWKAIPLIFCSLLLTLAGCAVIPGTQSTYSDTKSTMSRESSSKLDCSLVAKCVIKNIDERLAFMVASLSPEVPHPNVLEHRGRSNAGFAAIIGVASSNLAVFT